MIGRLVALLLLVWALGFAAFMLALPRPAAATIATDAIVVPTGASGRIQRGLALLEQRRARRMLVTGTGAGVTRGDMARAFGHAASFRCCVDLGAEAVDTRSNGEETAAWVRRHRYRSVRLVTSDWHMRRARMELSAALGGDVAVVEDAVTSEPALGRALNEYHKLVLRRAVLWWQAWRG